MLTIVARRRSRTRGRYSPTFAVTTCPVLDPLFSRHRLHIAIPCTQPPSKKPSRPPFSRCASLSVGTTRGPPTGYTTTVRFFSNEQRVVKHARAIEIAISRHSVVRNNQFFLLLSCKRKQGRKTTRIVYYG